MVQSQAKTEALIDVLQDIKGVQFPEVFSGVGGQYRIVEAFDVETNHQIRLLQVN